jgi:hypothetical protein
MNLIFLIYIFKVILTTLIILKYIMPKILLPEEIMAHIASFLPNDLLIIKFYSIFPEYKDSSYLPRLSNNYNYFMKNYKLAHRLLKYGYKLKISTNFKSLPLLVNDVYNFNVVSLNVYINHKTIIMRSNIYAFKYLEELKLSEIYIDLNVKKLPETLKIYKFCSLLVEPNIKKYENIGIKCINLANI